MTLFFTHLKLIRAISDRNTHPHSTSMCFYDILKMPYLSSLAQRKSGLLWSKEEKSFISRGVLTAVFPFTPISQLDKARITVLMWQLNPWHNWNQREPRSPDFRSPCSWWQPFHFLKDWTKHVVNICLFNWTKDNAYYTDAPQLKQDHNETHESLWTQL